LNIHDDRLYRGRATEPDELVSVQAGDGFDWSHLGEDGELEQQGWSDRSLTQDSGHRRSVIHDSLRLD